MVEQQRYSLGDPAWVTVTTDADEVTVPYTPDGVSLPHGIAVVVKPERDGDRIMLSSADAAVRYVRLRWARPMPIAGKYLADDWERAYGTLGFHGMLPNRIMPWYFLVVTDDATCGYGVKVRPNAMCFWQADTAGLTLEMDVRNGGAGVRLQDGSLTVATVISCRFQGMDSFAAACRFCAMMCNDPLLPDGPVYGGNNWYYAYGKSSAEAIARDADYIASLTRGNTVRPYMVIDDGWQCDYYRYDGYNGGPWRSGNERFPDMAQLAERIAESGVRPGIWVRLLLNEDPLIPADWRLPNGCLDPTHPEALAYIRDDVATLCRWGYQLIKHDFSTWDLFGRWGHQMDPLVTAEADWHFHDRSLTNAQVVKQLYRVIYEAARPYGTVILGCDTIGHLGAGLMHISRVGDDISGLDWERTRKNGVNTLAFRLPQHNTFFEVDADCVGITDAVDWRFNRQWADVVARSGTSLFVSVAPHTMKADDERDLKDSLRLASERSAHLRPLDWEYTDCPETWGDGETVTRYQWYDERGIHYSRTPKRHIGYLAIDE